MNKQLSHIDDTGSASMVDVSNKKATVRTAVASGKVVFPSAIFDTLAFQTMSYSIDVYRKKLEPRKLKIF